MKRTFRRTWINKNHLHVTCAIIERNGAVLAARRGETMAMPLKWELPGGKIKSGETPEDCLRREIAEELNVTIAVHQSLAPVTHAYPSFTITLYPFICSIAGGDIKLREHAAVAWLPRNQLFTLDWAEADLPVVDAYCRLFLKTERGYTILAFARSQKNRNGCTVPFVYLGPIDRISHESERPIKMIWRLRHPMPVEMFEENKRGG